MKKMLSPTLRKYVIVFGAISATLILASIIVLKSCIVANTNSLDIIGGTVSPTAVWIKGTNIRFNPKNRRFCDYAPFNDTFEKWDISATESNLVLQAVESFYAEKQRRAEDMERINAEIEALYSQLCNEIGESPSVVQDEAVQMLKNATISYLKKDYPVQEIVMKPFILSDSVGKNTKIVAIQLFFNKSNKKDLWNADLAFTLYYNFDTERITTNLQDYQGRLFSPFPPFYIYTKESFFR